MMHIKKTIFVSVVAYSLCYGENISLVDACKLGIENEPSLKSNELQVKSLTEDIEQAKSKFLPQMETVISYLDRKSLVNYKNEYEREKVKSYAINLRQPIYHPENYATLRKSKYRYSAEVFGFENLKQDLLGKIAEAYINVLKAQNKINLSKFYIESAESNLNQMERMFNLGLADKMKYLQARVDFDNSKLHYQNEINQLSLALTRFRLLTDSKSVPAEIIPSKINNIDDMEKFAKIDDSFKIRQLKEYTKVLKSDMEYAKYLNYPKIDFSASYTKFEPDNNNVTDYLNDKTFRIELKLPIYSGGAIASSQRKAELLFKAGNYDLDDSKRKEQIALDDALAKYNFAKSNIKLYDDSLESSKLFLHAVNQGYDKGLKSLIEVQEAKSKLEEIKYKRSDNFYEYLINYILILKHSGILDIESLQKINS